MPDYETSQGMKRGAPKEEVVVVAEKAQNRVIVQN